MSPRAVALLVAAVFAALAVGGTWLASRMNEIAMAASALPPRRFDQLTLLAIGTGGAYENPLRRGPCIAVGSDERVVLVDAGRGVADGLRAAEIPVDQPDTVYLTSLLPENTVGLDDLLLTGWLWGRRAPLRVVGPPGTRDLVAALFAAHRRGRTAQAEALGLPAAGAAVEAVEIVDGAGEADDRLSVRAAALDGGPLPARAYRFESAGRSAVVSGVGWDPEALVELAAGAHLLVHEAFFAESVEMAVEAGADDPERLRQEAALRTPLAEAGRLARRAGVEALALVRLRPAPLFDFQATAVAGEGYKGRILVPADGDELTP